MPSFTDFSRSLFIFVFIFKSNIFLEINLFFQIDLSFNDESIWENKFISNKLLDLNINKKINKLLEKSVKEGTSKAAFIKGKKIYGKTGTSDGNKDLWFIGSIDNLTTGIWIGHDDYKESELSSANAAYLWKKFIAEIFKIQIKN